MRLKSFYYSLVRKLFKKVKKAHMPRLKISFKKERDKEDSFSI